MSMSTSYQMCDYQSERHCSKTSACGALTNMGAITSQNGTAPKQAVLESLKGYRAITSQNGTAPKLCFGGLVGMGGAITSQNGTAPKQAVLESLKGYRAITSQNGTAPKLIHCLAFGHPGAITSQNGTAPKLTHCVGSLRSVRLPVRTALLQNGDSDNGGLSWCDYQSERHCSKTR